MKANSLASISIVILILSSSVFSQTPLFTYQGKLTDTGTPPTGTYQMEFRLFDAGGAQIAVDTNNAVSVTAGVFTVNLNFGSTAFPGADRFLQISVRRNAGESFVTLSPRQQIASSPYSIRTLSAAQADRALDSNGLGGVPANQYLQTNGNGSGLTNLNASSIATGTLDNARLGQIPTANIADAAVTSAKIANGQVVKGVTVGATTLTDNVTLAGSGNITITPSGNTLTIASTGGGVSGGGTTNTIPLWTGGTTLGNSVITQSFGNVGIGTSTLNAKLVVNGGVESIFPNGDALSGESTVGFGVFGRTVSGIAGVFGQAGGSGSGVEGTNTGGTGTGTGVLGRSTTSTGVYGTSSSGTGVEGASISGIGVSGVSTNRAGVLGTGFNQGSIALRASGTSWFQGDTTPLQNTSGTGILIGTAPALGYIQAFDYSTGAKILTLNNSGGNVGVGTAAPQRILHVNGRARIGSIPQEPSFAAVCFSQEGDLLQCGGSSLRWKTNVQPFRTGLDIITRLKPITYNWKESGKFEIGLGAEDVAKVDPTFTSTNDKGEITGVKYERLNMLLINAVKEQQGQIDEQKKTINELRQIVCELRPKAKGCSPK